MGPRTVLPVQRIAVLVSGAGMVPVTMANHVVRANKIVGNATPIAEMGYAKHGKTVGGALGIVALAGDIAEMACVTWARIAIRAQAIVRDAAEGLCAAMEPATILKRGLLRAQGIAATAGMGPVTPCMRMFRAATEIVISILVITTGTVKVGMERRRAIARMTVLSCHLNHRLPRRVLHRVLRRRPA